MKTQTIDPGAMTARLVLERPLAEPDGQGGALLAWEGYDAAWVRIEPLRATVLERAGAATVTVTHRLWLAHRDDLAAGMRLVKGSRMFVIRALHDPDETRRFLVLSCEEIGA